ncbi:MAG: adenine phosphoribosyltransferase [Gemmatimonadetes bacterium]|nr:adenine phosphoribosyltransferase [Gemmatimonadota bacterium]
MPKSLYAGIRDVPDFPRPGILFKDITPLLLDPTLFRRATQLLLEPVRSQQIDKIVAIESRGFIFGAPLAMELGAGLVPARKKGKLPWKTHQVEYALEYGTDTIEIHRDAIRRGERVLIVDDLLATGGTASATVQAVERAGGVIVGVSVLIELKDLDGRSKLDGTEIHTVLSYPLAPGE